MPMSLDRFRTICHRISLNLPATSAWQWDERLGHACVVFDKEDLESILLPVILEFDQQWDFDAVDASAAPVARFLRAGFGLMPGQDFFVAYHDAGAAVLLYATCWPWGDGDTYSLRVGLICTAEPILDPDQVRACLADWLRIQPA
jgi:hypothetical protein